MKTEQKKTEAPKYNPAVEVDALAKAVHLVALKTIWPKRHALDKKLASARNGREAREEKAKKMRAEVTAKAAEISACLDKADTDGFARCVAEHDEMVDALQKFNEENGSASVQKLEGQLAALETERAETEKVLLGAAVQKKIEAVEQKALAFQAEVAEVILLRAAARARGAKLKVGSERQRSSEALDTLKPLLWMASRDALTPATAAKGDEMSKSLAALRSSAPAPVPPPPATEAIAKSLAALKGSAAPVVDPETMPTWTPAVPEGDEPDGDEGGDNSELIKTLQSQK